MVATALLVGIGILDWRRRRIPNLLCGVLALYCYSGYFLHGRLSNIELLLNLTLALAFTLPGYVKGSVGGGDVKLMIAVAPLWHFQEFLMIFAGGNILVLAAMYSRVIALRITQGHMSNIIGHSREIQEGYPERCPLNEKLPLGSAIALGACAYQLFLNWPN